MSVTITSGVGAARQGQRLAAVRGASHDLEIALDLEQRSERAEHHRLILGNQDADHACVSLPRRRVVGAVSLIVMPRDPSPVRGLPPISRARARMPSRP